MSIRLLHLGDIHPRNDGTIAGKMIVDPETGQNQTLSDLKKSLAFVVGTATAPGTRCDAAVLTGDLFDSPRPHMDEVRIIKAVVLALSAEMPVLAIPGNHDLSQNPQSASALECLRGIPNVYIRETPETLFLQLGAQRTRFSFLGYPSKGRILTQDAGKNASPEEITATINAGLRDILRSFQADDEVGVPSVLLAHGSVANATIGEQPRSLAYDIQIPLEECAPFTYVALGHIHHPQQVAPNAWYSGSLMRQSFGEEHEQKGFNLVTLAAGQPARVTFIQNPHARRYRTLRTMPTAQEIEHDPSLTDPAIVWRFKGQMSPEDYDQMKATLQGLETTLPHFQTDIEIRAEDRARDAGMAQCLDMRQALTRALAGKIEDVELPMILEKHEALLTEVGT